MYSKNYKFFFSFSVFLFFFIHHSFSHKSSEAPMFRCSSAFSIFAAARKIIFSFELRTINHEP